jgi:transglutaminase-like putative cysteine protease
LWRITRPKALQTAYPLEQYLRCSAYIDFDHPLIQEFLARFRGRERSEVETARELFVYIRDAIAHSGDIKSHRVTRKASEVLQHGEGICYAKSHLLAALFRGAGIPAGICYQKLTRGATPETGYCIHALNTLYLSAEDRWIRVDARGNKPGIDAQFAIELEQLAFPVREECGEIDYLINHPEPHPTIIETLERHEDCRVMYGTGRLPTDLRYQGSG